MTAFCPAKQAFYDACQKQRGFAVMNIGGRYHHRKQKAVLVHRHMPFDAFRLFVAVITVQGPVVAPPHALAVHYRQACCLF